MWYIYATELSKAFCEIEPVLKSLVGLCNTSLLKNTTTQALNIAGLPLLGQLSPCKWKNLNIMVNWENRDKFNLHNKNLKQTKRFTIKNGLMWLRYKCVFELCQVCPICNQTRFTCLRIRALQPELISPLFLGEN